MLFSNPMRKIPCVVGFDEPLKMRRMLLSVHPPVLPWNAW